MKKSFIILTVLLLFSTSIFAKEPVKKENEVQLNRTVLSLMDGLNSDNMGLKSGSIYMLGELKVSESVIPLMKILKNQNDETLKVSAALALYKIGDSRGLYAIKRSGKFETNERVRKICDLFYRNFIGQKESKTELLSLK
jgi:hypothetical protein